MKKLFNILIFLLLPILLFGQIDLEKRLTKKVVYCNDIAINSSDLFIQYIKSNQFDSARIVVDFWEKNCDLSEPILRAKILLEILSSELNESTYDSTILENVINFITRLDFSKLSNYRENYEYYAPYFGFVPLNSDYDRSTKEIAQEIKNFDNDLELLYSLLYSEKIDEFYHKLQESEYENYTIRMNYDKQIHELKKLPDGHYDISIGAFIPTSKASLLGFHPTLGISGGLKFKKITYDFTMDMRFGSTRDKYQVIKSDTLITDYYFGAYFGFDISYDILRYKKSELLLLGGIGFDGFDTELTSSDNGAVVSVLSANLNGGLMYRWYYNNENYIGICYQYNFVNYNSDKIVNDLTGNFHSIALSFGGVNNREKREGLKQLRYIGK